MGKSKGYAANLQERREGIISSAFSVWEGFPTFGIARQPNRKTYQPRALIGTYRMEACLLHGFLCTDIWRILLCTERFCSASERAIRAIKYA